jgi:tetratricopeptide (TPR) repeat protein
MSHVFEDSVTVCVQGPAEVIIVREMQAFSLAALVVALSTQAPKAPPQAAAQMEATAGYYFMLGRHLENEGKIPEAIAAHRKAIALDPASAELHAELAGLYARQDEAIEALTEAEAAVAREPGNPEGNRIIGSIYSAFVDQRRPIRPGDDVSTYAGRAIAALELARKDRPLDVNVELMLGRLYLRGGSPDQAIPNLRRVVADQPGYPEAAMLLSGALESTKQIDGAIRVLEEALEENPTFWRGLVKLGELYEGERKFKEAAATYSRAQIANPRLNLVPQQAAALLNAGDPTAARDVLQQSLARRSAPPDPTLLYLLGQTQRQLKDYDGATQTVEKLKAIDPDDPRAMYLSARLLDDRGQKHEAVAAFEALIKRSPGDASLVYEYANLLEKSGRVPEAERALRDRLAADPLDANALNALGYMFAERNMKLDEAVSLLQRALKVEPSNPSFLDSLGWAYFQQGKLDLADPRISEAASKLPTSSAVQDHLGDLRFKQQRYADAAAAWERSLSADGEAIDRAKVEQKLRDARTRLKK